jgi:hypothetical protein
MRHIVATVTAIRLALSARRDLLLEMLALHHQVAVLARSNRRFRPSDRLLWLILRRLWRQWRDALVLVQPATVDRWYRDLSNRRWWRRSRRPGRPCINSQCRELIERLAEENHLWDAPRIHGELLKLGLVVSERTVSRYLARRPRRPSQTWCTFLANHLSQFTCMSSVLSPHAPADEVVDASAGTRRSTQSPDRLSASRQCARVDCPASVRPKCLGVVFTQEHPRDRRNTRRSGRDPPRTGCVRPTHGGTLKVDSFSCTGPTATIAGRDRCVTAIAISASIERENVLGLRCGTLRGDSQTVGILAKHTVPELAFARPGHRRSDCSSSLVFDGRDSSVAAARVASSSRICRATRATTLRTHGCSTTSRGSSPVGGLFGFMGATCLFHQYARRDRKGHWR